ncbi:MULTISPECIES: peptide-methionine (R)-S-oxide reductase MsrB [Empedobacter]|uniref:Peptide methionine sulfoxide reductase MsrB n=3 Tax=Empedobacter TaxID=59734 RepID=A0A427BKN6_9FLAO|nr:peptide-methionine (R)-S-oxide reductase MsrB [Empedobacter sp. R132-2]RRT90106.1 peptide-methionine (R)-S-oxide reductase [Empedobacter falsenii]RRT90117.1 peptide-methionine (R)-S-oxide reductase [Empedobacter falsenii]
MDCLKKYTSFFVVGLIMSLMAACTSQHKKEDAKVEQPSNTVTMNEKPQFNINKSNEEWKKELSSEEYYVLREAGTERPFTGKFNMHFENGIYTCNACGEELFSSSSKFDGHCGWPSFDKEIKEGKIVERVDTSHGMKRTEILCGNCGSHLGHVFDDGPTETGLRYCVNSLSLDFKPVK